MNHYVYDIESANARIFKQRHYQFDYLESDTFEKMQNSKEDSLIGYINLKENEKEDASDKVIISSGLTDHYFQLMPADKIRHLNKRNLIGYVMVSTNTYVAVYKHSILIPLLLSIAFLAVFCTLIL